MILSVIGELLNGLILTIFTDIENISSSAIVDSNLILLISFLSTFLNIHSYQDFDSILHTFI